MKRKAAYFINSLLIVVLSSMYLPSVSAAETTNMNSAEEIFTIAKAEDKQILVELLESKEEHSLLKTASLANKYKKTINIYQVIKGTKIYKSLHIENKTAKFLLISNDKILKSYISNYDLLLLENTLSLFISTLNIKRQIDYLLITNSLPIKEAEEIIAGYYARHDKKKYPNSSAEYFLKLYTLDRKMYKNFQKTYMKIWSNS